MKKKYVISLLIGFMMIMGITVISINLSGLRSDLKETKAIAWSLKHDNLEIMKNRLNDLIYDLTELKYKDSLRIVYEDIPIYTKIAIRHEYQAYSHFAVVMRYLENKEYLDARKEYYEEYYKENY